MHSTHLRREHIHGVLLGVATGDAIGACYSGLSEQRIARLTENGINYRFPRGFSFYGEDTRMMLLGAQAFLNSRSEMDRYRTAFLRRLTCYALSFPPGIRATHLLSGLRAPLRVLGLNPASSAVNLDPATRAVFSTLAVHGGGHRLSKWIELTTKLTHSSSEVLDACQMLAGATQYAITNPVEEFDPEKAIARIRESALSDASRERVKDLHSFLSDQMRPDEVASRWNMLAGGSRPSVTTQTMLLLYCWLGSPNDFEQAITNSLRLGGRTNTTCAIVGGLVGSHVGMQGLPESLTARVQGWPHGSAWFDQLARRFAHWPHGADDLHGASGEASEPAMQLLRNLLLYPANLIRLARKTTLHLSPLTKR